MYRLLLAAAAMTFASGCHARCRSFDAEVWSADASGASGGAAVLRFPVPVCEGGVESQATVRQHITLHPICILHEPGARCIGQSALK